MQFYVDKDVVDNQSDVNSTEYECKLVYAPVHLSVCVCGLLTPCWRLGVPCSPATSGGPVAAEGAAGGVVWAVCAMTA